MFYTVEMDILGGLVYLKNPNGDVSHHEGEAHKFHTSLDALELIPKIAESRLVRAVRVVRHEFTRAIIAEKSN